MSRIAAYDGTCVVCGERIEGGYDTIAFDEREDTWIHEACWTDPHAPAKRRPGSKPTLADKIKAGLES